MIKYVATFAILSFLSIVADADNSVGYISTQNSAPVFGAMVTAFSKSSTTALTVFTDAEGKFTLPSLSFKPEQIRIRHPHFKDDMIEWSLFHSSDTPLHIQLQNLSFPEEIAQSLPSSAYVSSYNFGDNDIKKEFVSQCLFCHQIGNATTRIPRPVDAWNTLIDRMEGMGAIITFKTDDSLGSILHNEISGKPVLKQHAFTLAPQVLQSTIREWSLAEPTSYIHDIEIGQDQKIYGVDMGTDSIYVLDPKTNTIEKYSYPPNNYPLGGMFSGAFHPLGTFAAYHAPHSLQTGPDGKMWSTNSLAAELSSFDPQTKIFKTYDIKHQAVYPHTLRFDKEGKIWFTIALTNQIGMFDPKTEKFTIVKLPSHGFFRWLTESLVPVIIKVAAWFPQKNYHIALSLHKITGLGHKIFNLPYGIDISPIDGSVWYSKLYSGYIGRLDPKTLQVEEIETPLAGPRRMRFSQDGTLWIPSYEESSLMKFNPTNKKFTTYKIPTLAPDEFETPYALNIHPQTQEVWITAGLSDRILRFIPSSESFISYPLPTRVTSMREIVFTHDGQVCSSYSNLPAYSIEGGLPKIVCVSTSDQVQ